MEEKISSWQLKLRRRKLFHRKVMGARTNFRKRSRGEKGKQNSQFEWGEQEEIKRKTSRGSTELPVPARGIQKEISSARRGVRKSKVLGLGGESAGRSGRYQAEGQFVCSERRGDWAIGGNIPERRIGPKGGRRKDQEKKILK